MLQVIFLSTGYSSFLCSDLTCHFFQVFFYFKSKSNTFALSLVLCCISANTQEGSRLESGTVPATVMPGPLKEGSKNRFLHHCPIADGKVSFLGVVRRPAETYR